MKKVEVISCKVCHQILIANGIRLRMECLCKDNKNYYKVDPKNFTFGMKGYEKKV